MRRAAALALRAAEGSQASTSGWSRAVGGTACCRCEPVAQADLEYEVETIEAVTRGRAGRLPAKQLRKEGRVPAVIFSLPGEAKQLITLDKRAVERLMGRHGRSGLTSRLFSLSLEDAETGDRTIYPVLPKQVHRTATSGAVENVTFLFCPGERTVQVDVPIKILGEDVSPGVKKGGFVALRRPRVRCACPGDSILASLELDVSALELGDKVGCDALCLPAGVQLAEKHTGDPICKIAGKAARD